jgi:hypothetical protein
VRTHHEISVPPRPKPLFIHQIQLVEVRVQRGDAGEVVAYRHIGETQHALEVCLGMMGESGRWERSGQGRTREEGIVRLDE